MPKKIKYKGYSNFGELLEIVNEHGFNYYRYVYEKFNDSYYLVNYYQGIQALCKAFNILAKGFLGH